MSTTPERDAQLMAVGKQCSHPQCTLIDFLPFKCQHCQESFCQDHYRVNDGHSCAKYDESKHNRVAPECPLCHVPIAVKPGQDPNIRMDQHLDTECSIVTGRVQAKKTPICGRNNCKKILFSPIRCDQCKGQFCPSHRFPSDHTCKAPAPQNANAAAARPNMPTMASASSAAKNVNAKVGSKANEAVSSMKQGVAAAKASTSEAAASASKSMPFNKTDRQPPSPLSSRPLATTTTPIVIPTNTTLPESTNEPTKRPPPVIPPVSSFTPRPLFGWA